MALGSSVNENELNNDNKITSNDGVLKNCEESDTNKEGELIFI